LVFDGPGMSLLRLGSDSTATFFASVVEMPHPPTAPAASRAAATKARFLGRASFTTPWGFIDMTVSRPAPSVMIGRSLRSLGFRSRDPPWRLPGRLAGPWLSAPATARGATIEVVRPDRWSFVESARKRYGNRSTQAVPSPPIPRAPVDPR